MSQVSARRTILTLWVCAGVLLPGTRLGAAEAKTFLSHPPLRPLTITSNRPMGKGPAHFVDAAKGDDKSEGTESKPWRTLAHAAGQLKPGETLYLRGGTYYENLTLSTIGTTDKPIVIRSHPGEVAILDGGLREFFEQPATSWEPYAKGHEGEYRSARAYPNLRHVLGSFGDSMIGLVTYYHARDLRAQGECFELDEATKDFKPIYCGPGIWYDPATGYIHARLAHTQVPGFDNYRGETDPRRLPLVIAPFRSVPFHLDGAQHVRFQDLIIRGSGYDSIKIDQSTDIEFDNVTVWCGTFGLRATGTQRLKFHRSALYGSIPPWLSRAECGLQSYPGRSERDIARLNTHALLVPEANPESSVYAFPFNDDWEFSYSDFTESSDGVYLGGVTMKFHHNLVDNMQDDGLYLSPMYARPERFMGKGRVDIFQNYLSRALTMLAFGGTETRTDTIYFHRNIIDLRAPIRNGRPSSKAPGPVPPYAGHVMGDHGSPPWPAMFTYHNTIVSREGGRAADFVLTAGSTAERSRRVFNNILVHGKGLSSFALPDAPFIQSDGNLYWQPGMDTKVAAEFFTTYRASPAFANSKKAYPPGFDAGSLVAAPKFIKTEFDAKAVNDYRLQPGSPAVDAGVAIPAEWPDPLRAQDKSRPDVGALPLGSEPFQAGRAAAPKP